MILRINPCSDLIREQAWFVFSLYKYNNICKTFITKNRLCCNIVIYMHSLVLFLDQSGEITDSGLIRPLFCADMSRVLLILSSKSASPIIRFR